MKHPRAWILMAVRSLRALACPACVCLTAVGGVASVRAHPPGVVLSGTGTATIDGTLAPGEWDGAGRVDVLVNLPGGTGTAQATLFAMNDGATLYLGWRIDNAAPFRVWMLFEFDNDHDASPENGDDVIEWLYGGTGDYSYLSGWTCPAVCSAGYCGPLDDLDFGTTNDVGGAATDDGAALFYEMVHPLGSGDPYDFSLGPDDTVGFKFSAYLDPLTNCSPPSATVAGDIVIGPAADRDGDGIPDVVDNCPDDANAGQTDADGDGHGIACDCDDANSVVHPGAPETNNGRDDDCDGLVDEGSDDAGFCDPSICDDPSAGHCFCWSPQPGADTYQVARLFPPHAGMFAADCVTTADASWSDPEVPAPGQVFHYLHRPLSPFAGSWGEMSDGGEREIFCRADYHASATLEERYRSAVADWNCPVVQCATPIGGVCLAPGACSDLY